MTYKVSIYLVILFLLGIDALTTHLPINRLNYGTNVPLRPPTSPLYTSKSTALHLKPRNGARYTQNTPLFSSRFNAEHLLCTESPPNQHPRWLQKVAAFFWARLNQVRRNPAGLIASAAYIGTLGEGKREHQRDNSKRLNRLNRLN